MHVYRHTPTWLIYRHTLSHDACIQAHSHMTHIQTHTRIWCMYTGALPHDSCIQTHSHIPPNSLCDRVYLYVPVRVCLSGCIEAHSCMTHSTIVFNCGFVRGRDVWRHTLMWLIPLLFSSVCWFVDGMGRKEAHAHLTHSRLFSIACLFVDTGWRLIESWLIALLFSTLCVCSWTGYVQAHSHMTHFISLLFSTVYLSVRKVWWLVESWLFQLCVCSWTGYIAPRSTAYCMWSVISSFSNLQFVSHIS